MAENNVSIDLVPVSERDQLDNILPVAHTTPTYFIFPSSSSPPPPHTHTFGCYRRRVARRDDDQVYFPAKAVKHTRSSEKTRTVDLDKGETKITSIRKSLATPELYCSISSFFLYHIRQNEAPGKKQSQGTSVFIQVRK